MAILRIRLDQKEGGAAWQERGTIGNAYADDRVIDSTRGNRVFAFVRVTDMSLRDARKLLYKRLDIDALREIPEMASRRGRLDAAFNRREWVSQDLFPAVTTAEIRPHISDGLAWRHKQAQLAAEDDDAARAVR